VSIKKRKRKVLPEPYSP